MCGDPSFDAGHKYMCAGSNWEWKLKDHCRQAPYEFCILKITQLSCVYFQKNVTLTDTLILEEIQACFINDEDSFKIDWVYLHFKWAAEDGVAHRLKGTS